MKSKTFVEPRWLAAVFFGMVYLVGGGGGAIFFAALWISDLARFGLGDTVLTVLIEILCLVIGVTILLSSVPLYVLYLLPKSFSLLTVSQQKIIWRCPFYPSVKMRIEDCEYVSVEDMADHNMAMPVIRGDEIAYIYLSDKPFPDKYKHKADIVRRKKGTITFAYSDKLCQELISVLPKEKTGCLVSFYNRMQAADRVNKLKKKNKKKGKSKKK